MKGSDVTDQVRYRDFFDWFRARIQNNNDTILLEKVKNGWQEERIELHFSQLKECECQYLVKYVDAMKKNNELWVIIPYRVDRIDCS